MKLHFGPSKTLNRSFSEEYNTGCYRDTSLSSLETRRKREARDRARTKKRVENIERLRKKMKADAERKEQERLAKRNRRIRENHAAIVIQKRARPYVAKLRKQREVRRRRERTRAATKIQSVVRMFLGKINYDNMREDYEFASKTLQCTIRKFLRVRRARCLLRRLREERDALRELVARQYWDEHASVIQRHIRGRQHRAFAKKYRSDRADSEAKQRDKIKRRREKAMRKAEEAARRARARYTRS